MDNLDLRSALKPELIDISNPTIENKDELFSHMSNLFFKAGCVESAEEFKKALYEREETGSTYMGNYLAVPHGKSFAVKEASVAICRSKPFMYTSNDFSGEVKLSVMLAIPEKASNDGYVRMLSTVTRLLMDPEFEKVLFNSNDSKEIVEVAIKQAEKLKPLS